MFPETIGLIALAALVVADIAYIVYSYVRAPRWNFVQGEQPQNNMTRTRNPQPPPGATGVWIRRIWPWEQLRNTRAWVGLFFLVATAVALPAAYYLDYSRNRSE